MLALIVVLAVVIGILGFAFWNATRAGPNTGPALGTNNPYPGGVGLPGPGEDAPPFMLGSHTRLGSFSLTLSDGYISAGPLTDGSTTLH